jgi:ArsR family metal-binding transcriptional regulator
MQPGMTVDQMSGNINAIIDYIEELFPEFDIADLDGYMIVTGDLPNVYTFLNVLHTLIVSSLEEEEEEEVETAEEKMRKQIEREKERKLQEKQLAEDPSALPVGNIRDLLRKK